MPHVVWGAIATSGPMGQQRYETEIQDVLRQQAQEWKFTSTRVTSSRSNLPNAKRLPARINMRAPLALSRMLGGYVYGRPDLVHRFDLRLPAAAGAEVVTVHDLPPLRFTDEGALPRAAVSSARRAHRIIVPSSFAKNELRSLLGVERVEVIPYGVSDEYAKADPATDSELHSYQINKPFLLHAAGATQRKNLHGLAESWRALNRHHDLQLVLCGPPDPRRDRAFEGCQGVVKTGRLESRVVASLMRRAEAVVVPSLYEGFGLPALEGMVCGVPVVAARRGALPEVCGASAVLTEPEGEALAEGIARVIDDSDLNASLRSSGPARASQFSWEKAGREHLRVYEEALQDVR